MTKTLDTAFKAAKTLPESRQEELAQWVMDVVNAGVKVHQMPV